jgi:hypothetical protein
LFDAFDGCHLLSAAPFRTRALFLPVSTATFATCVAPLVDSAIDVSDPWMEGRWRKRRLGLVGAYRLVVYTWLGSVQWREGQRGAELFPVVAAGTWAVVECVGEMAVSH